MDLEQKTGFLLSPTGQIVTKGYSGAPGYVDNPDDEAMQNKGPLPRGVYSIAAPQDTEAHGPYAMALSPFRTRQNVRTRRLHDPRGFNRETGNGFRRLRYPVSRSA